MDAPRLDPAADALAFIDLTTRRVTVNPRKVEELKAVGSLEAILAHELGHHLRYPHSLATQARLELFERELLPIHGYSLLNLFTDYLINTDLGRDRELMVQLAAVYRGVSLTARSCEEDPAFIFYLTCFEEAWGLPPRDLTRDAGAALEQRFPGCRAEAQLLAQELPNLAPNLFTQLVYFASVVSRYQILDPEKPDAGGKEMNPTHGDHSRPSAGDYADALKRSAQESEAIRRAIERGWLKPERIPDQAQSERIRAASLPGVLAGEPKKLEEAMALHYRRLAEKYLFRPRPGSGPASRSSPRRFRRGGRGTRRRRSTGWPRSFRAGPNWAWRLHSSATSSTTTPPKRGGTRRFAWRSIWTSPARCRTRRRA